MPWAGDAGESVLCLLDPTGSGCARQTGTGHVGDWDTAGCSLPVQLRGFQGYLAYFPATEGIDGRLLGRRGAAAEDDEVAQVGISGDGPGGGWRCLASGLWHCRLEFLAWGAANCHIDVIVLFLKRNAGGSNVVQVVQMLAAALLQPWCRARRVADPEPEHDVQYGARRQT